MEQRLFDIMEMNPVIAAVKDKAALERCCELEEIRIAFTLFGDICSIGEIVHQLKDAGKIVFVHADLVSGLASKDLAADFIHRHTQADGLISTKPSIIRKANELQLATILRVFLLDSMAIAGLPHQISMAKPDIVEVLPGLMPQMIQKIKNTTRLPMIAGGLISEKEDVMDALDAGAICVSSTSQKVWMM